MDNKKAAFLARLRETFRTEASEHIAAIAAGLMGIERPDGGDRLAQIEKVFREAHSLKGAARSVNLPDVESLCAELESIFAAAKRGALLLSTEELNAVHPTLALLETWCAHPGAPSTLEDRERAGRLQESLRGLSRAADQRPTGLPAEPAHVEPAHVEAAPVEPAAASRESTRLAAMPPVESARLAGAPETVRVSTGKLAGLLLDAEELIAAKIAAVGRTGELRDISDSAAMWITQRLRPLVRDRRRNHSERDDDALESVLLHAQRLEHSLRKLLAAAQQDAVALGAMTDRLVEAARNVLLFPCSQLLGPLPAVLRALAQEQGKEADLVIHGEDIQIDRRVLDELKDPVIHLLRNAVDHGIERPEARLAAGKTRRATVSISARPIEGNRVEFLVDDDGAGIDPVKVRSAAVRLGLTSADDLASLAGDDVLELVFRSGLSTSPIITELSGRGLGLAIVREKVERVGGSVSVESKLGKGTAFRLVVPVSIATFRGVFVEAAGRPFVVPTANVVRAARVRLEDLKTIENRQTVSLDGRAVSVVRLRDVLRLSAASATQPAATLSVLVVRSADQQIALLVDRINDEGEVVVKMLGRQLTRVRHVSGVSVTGNRTVVPILNVPDLIHTAGTMGAAVPAGGLPEPDGSEGATRRRLLIAEDSITARALVKNILEGAGYDVVAAVDGLDALTKLKTDVFDGVVSDIDMPRMNGFELTSRIRADKKLGALPVVLVTALGSQKDREYGIEVGANAYIVKSDFDQSNLIEIIKRLL